MLSVTIWTSHGLGGSGGGVDEHAVAAKPDSAPIARAAETKAVILRRRGGVKLASMPGEHIRSAGRSPSSVFKGRKIRQCSREPRPWSRGDRHGKRPREAPHAVETLLDRASARCSGADHEGDRAAYPCVDDVHPRSR